MSLIYLQVKRRKVVISRSSRVETHGVKEIDWLRRKDLAFNRSSYTQTNQSSSIDHHRNVASTPARAFIAPRDVAQQMETRCRICTRKVVAVTVKHVTRESKQSRCGKQARHSSHCWFCLFAIHYCY